MPRTRSETPTRGQLNVLEAYRRLTKKLGWPPTLMEVAHELGFSSDNSIRCHLRQLELRGLVTRVSRSPRAVRSNKRARGAVWRLHVV